MNTTVYFIDQMAIMESRLEQWKLMGMTYLLKKMLIIMMRKEPWTPLFFFRDHIKTFPLLFILAQRHLSIVSNEAGAERVINLTGIIVDSMKYYISHNTYQTTVNHRANMDIVHILEKHVVCELLGRIKDGWIKKKHGVFLAIIEYEESRTLIWNFMFNYIYIINCIKC